MSTGKDYEVFVQSLQQALLDSEAHFSLKNIKVERNKKIADSFGCIREFDIYWEYELAGIIYKTVIECKDYASKVSVEKIDALLGKIRDIPDLKPVFATKNGYQRGAEQKAKNNRVELLIVRQQNNSDWISEDGTPYLREIHIHSSINQWVEIVNFEPNIDGNWVKENTDIDLSTLTTQIESNNEIIIDDVGNGKRYSLYDLQQQLTNDYNNVKSYGEHCENFIFSEAYLETSLGRLKLLSLKLSFKLEPPIHNEPTVIDYSKQLVGVIEYLSRGHKTAVFKDRVVKKWH